MFTVKLCSAGAHTEVHIECSSTCGGSGRRRIEFELVGKLVHTWSITVFLGCYKHPRKQACSKARNFLKSDKAKIGDNRWHRLDSSEEVASAMHEEARAESFGRRQTYGRAGRGASSDATTRSHCWFFSLHIVCDLTNLPSDDVP